MHCKVPLLPSLPDLLCPKQRPIFFLVSLLVPSYSFQAVVPGRLRRSLLHFRESMHSPAPGFNPIPFGCLFQLFLPSVCGCLFLLSIWPCRVLASTHPVKGAAAEAPLDAPPRCLRVSPAQLGFLFSMLGKREGQTFTSLSCGLEGGRQGRIVLPCF